MNLICVFGVKVYHMMDWGFLWVRKKKVFPRYSPSGTLHTQKTLVVVTKDAKKKKNEM